jgi:hypothetical protein
MIVLYTNYDNVAVILEGFARELVRLAGSKVALDLGPPSQSISTNVHAQLGVSSDPLFFFGHGHLTQSALMAQDQRPAIDGSNDHLLKDRFVYAACCDGMAILSNAVGTHNATVVGYSGKLKVPLENRYRSLMQHCTLAGPKVLMKGQTADDARNGIENEFRAAAQRLIATGRVRDAVVSVKVFDTNARLIALAGDASRTI